ncbi:MAG: hypothetical protein KGZ97_01200, partial [Bacteroidetes bacterium]|nr:hypothetical protein [Bacteroidota bacterium]
MIQYTVSEVVSVKLQWNMPGTAKNSSQVLFSDKKAALSYIQERAKSYLILQLSNYIEVLKKAKAGNPSELTKTLQHIVNNPQKNAAYAANIIMQVFANGHGDYSPPMSISIKIKENCDI